MQITIIAGGSRGDVQPYVALGKGLKEAGHTVRILSTDDFHNLVTDYGLDFFTTGGSSEVVARRMQALVEQGKMLKILSQMRDASQKQAVQAAEAGLIACEGSELILGGLGGLFSGLALSEKLAIPFLPAYLVPFTPTRVFPSALTPLPQTPLTRWLNKPSHRLAQQTMWQSFRSADNKARAAVLHLPPSSFYGSSGPSRWSGNNRRGSGRGGTVDCHTLFCRSTVLGKARLRIRCGASTHSASESDR